MRHGLRGPVVRDRLGLRRRRARDRRRRAADPVGRRRRGRHRRLRGRADAARPGRVRGARRAVGQRHLAPVRRPPRRLRDGRGRRRSSCSRTPRRRRRAGATILGDVRGYGASSDAYHLTAPEPGGPRRRRRRSRQALATPASRPRTSTTSTPTAPRRRSTTAAETKAIKMALGERAGEIPVSSTEVGDRAPARRRRRRRGGRDASSRCATGWRRPRSGYEEAEEGLDLDYVPDTARPLDVNGQPADRAVERVRVRRPQRRAVPGGAHEHRPVVTSSKVDKAARPRSPDRRGA